MNSVRFWIRGGFWMVSAWLLSGLANAEITVFADGKILLPVLIAPDALPVERSAAEELGRVLGLMSGLEWPVRFSAELGEKGFYVGRSSFSLWPAKPLIVAKNIFERAQGEVGPDAFRIQSSHGSVFIESSTPDAIGFAVDWFLQHQGGVRWYVPGAAGEIVPKRARWSLMDLNVLREPAYVSREISGLNSAEEKIWALRNGLRGRVEFTHAMDRVFSRSVLERHPDWSPLLDGKRHVPASDTDGNWQPNLALPEVADYAAKVACQAFAQDQARFSFSLGINDTVRFDQSEVTRALVEPLRYFRGMPDYSPLVFKFMNRAAQEVARFAPDRYLGCLAYFWCENPPPFPVHRDILPFVTTDRSQYFDREYREEDLALMAKWGASGVNAFGLWEYAYGRGFVIPRNPCHALAESIREGWHLGARGYFAEVEPHWGFDAFKVWMLARKMWDPELSIEDLENDFYGGYYGAAAGSMRLFFERCENQWMAQSGSPRWLKYYGQEDQALLFPPIICEKLKHLLEEAKTKVANSPVELIRVGRTERAFEVTEAFVRFDAMRRTLQGIRADEPLGEAALSDAIANLAKLRDILREKMKAAHEGENPAMIAGNLDGLLRNDPVPRLLWLAALRDSSAPSRILAAAGISKAQSRWWSVAVFFDSGKFRGAPNLVENGAFTQQTEALKEPRFLYPKFEGLPSKWKLQAMPTERGNVALVGKHSELRKIAVRIEGAYDTQLYQWLPAEPGCIYLAKAEVRGNSSSGNDSALFLTFLDRAGKLMGRAEMQSLPKGGTDNWRVAVLADRAPKGAAWVGVGGGASGQGVEDWMEISEIELRRVEVGSM